MPQDPARRLHNIDVQYISLVDKGANLKKIIFKSDELTENPLIAKTVEILKTDEEKHLVYGVVYSPEETDSQGDVASAEEIEKAAHAFMSNRRIHQVDKNHNLQPTEGNVVESWVTKTEDDIFGTEAPVGSWAVAIKVKNDETWAQIKKGEISGLSLMGNAEVEEVVKSDENWLNKLFERIGFKKSKFKDQITASKARRMMWDLTDAFQSGISEIMAPQFKGDKKNALLKMVGELQEYVENEFPAELVKEGRTLSGSNRKMIADVRDMLDKLLAATELKKQENETMTDEEKKAFAEEITKGVMEGINTKVDKGFNDLSDKVQKNSDAIADLKKSAGTQQQPGQETTTESEAATLAKEGKYKDEKGVVRKHFLA
jgi:hypothetical protein